MSFAGVFAGAWRFTDQPNLAPSARARTVAGILFASITSNLLTSSFTRLNKTSDPNDRLHMVTHTHHVNAWEYAIVAVCSGSIGQSLAKKQWIGSTVVAGAPALLIFDDVTPSDTAALDAARDN